MVAAEAQSEEEEETGKKEEKEEEDDENDDEETAEPEGNEEEGNTSDDDETEAEDDDDEASFFTEEEDEDDGTSFLTGLGCCGVSPFGRVLKKRPRPRSCCCLLETLSGAIHSGLFFFVGLTKVETSHHRMGTC